jgi:hypothetical protein
MEPVPSLRLHAVPHPSAQVRQAGFALDHPYLEQCWAPVIGPTSVLLLRRMPVLWRDGLTVEVDPAELAASLGLSPRVGRHGALARTLDRLERYEFAHRGTPGDLEVFTELPPVTQRHLDRLPAWSRQRHHELLGTHLDRLAARHSTPPAPTDIAARLEHMSRPDPSAHRPHPSLQ